MQEKRTLYDCFNAKVLGDRIACSKGHKLGAFSEDSKHIRALIRGKPLALSVCQDCPDFDQMDGGPVLPQDRGWFEMRP